MNPGNKKNMQTIDIFTYSIAVLGLLLAIMEVIRAVLYYNPATGLLDKTLPNSVMGGIFPAGLAAMLLLSWKLAAIVKEASVRIKPSLPLGIGLFVTGLFFVAQCIIDVIGGFVYVDGTPDTVGIATTLFCFFAAVTFILMAYIVVSTGKKPSSYFCIIPLLWNALAIIRLLLSYPDVVSVQHIAYKTIAAALSIWLLLDIARYFGNENSPSSLPWMLLRIAAPAIILTCSLPYGILLFAGVRDLVGATPYLALTGLGIYGVIITLQQIISAAFSLDHRRNI